MPTHPNIHNTFIHDNQTKKTVAASSLTTLRLAGWTNFQDTIYSQASPLTIPVGAETRVVFDRNNLDYLKEESLPQIGSTKYQLWDFDNDVFKSYKENRDTIYDVRFQMTARSTTATTGVALESIVRIPNSIAILRESETLAKGSQWQRVRFRVLFYVEEANIEDGLELYLEPFAADIEAYNFNLLIQSGA